MASPSCSRSTRRCRAPTDTSSCSTCRTPASSRRSSSARSRAPAPPRSSRPTDVNERDYDALAQRAFEGDVDDDLREQLRVCADALEQLGDPRGPLIAMELALETADSRRAAELRRAMTEH